MVRMWSGQCAPGLLEENQAERPVSAETELMQYVTPSQAFQSSLIWYCLSYVVGGVSSPIYIYYAAYMYFDGDRGSRSGHPPIEEMVVWSQKQNKQKNNSAVAMGPISNSNIIMTIQARAKKTPKECKRKGQPKKKSSTEKSPGFLFFFGTTTKLAAEQENLSVRDSFQLSEHS